MKKIITCLFALTFAYSISAQQLGVQAGLDLTNLNLSSSDTSVTFDMGTGYSFGVHTTIELSDQIQFKPGLLYAHRTATSTDEIMMGIDVKVTWKTDYIDIPLNFGYMVSDNITINAGPYVSLLLAAKADVEALGQTETEDIKEDTESMDYGINLGLTYNINETMMINAGYALGMASIIDEGDDKLTFSAIRISFGYVFGN